jgi:hypothetical protein
VEWTPNEVMELVVVVGFVTPPVALGISLILITLQSFFDW